MELKNSPVSDKALGVEKPVEVKDLLEIIDKAKVSMSEMEPFLHNFDNDIYKENLWQETHEFVTELEKTLITNEDCVLIKKERYKEKQ